MRESVDPTRKSVDPTLSYRHPTDILPTSYRHIEFRILGLKLDSIRPNSTRNLVESSLTFGKHGNDRIEFELEVAKHETRSD